MPQRREPHTSRPLLSTAFVVVLVVAAILTFGLGLALGRVWERGSQDPAQGTAVAAGGDETGPGATGAVTPSSDPEQDATSSNPTATEVAVQQTAAVSTPVPTVTPAAFFEGPIVYGRSYNGKDLVAYRLGTGASARALIGGIHGGYEWNSTLLVSETLAYLEEKPGLVPSDVTLYVVPCANPDGAAAGTDAIHGRMNGNSVDLNRNWDYKHQITATHGTRPVFAGNAPFSEPETQALRDFIFERDIELAIFYHSAMAKIFSGAERENCATFELAEMMSDVTGYPHSPEGIYGQITTGDAIDYLSKVGIAAIEIELTNHQDIDWDRNWRGVLAFMEWDIPGDAPRGTDGLMEHEVQPGETLSYLAIAYGVAEEEILRANAGLDNPDQILAGQVILIPQAAAEP